MGSPRVHEDGSGWCHENIQIHLLTAASEGGKMQINPGQFECIDINYNVLQLVSECGCLLDTYSDSTEPVKYMQSPFSFSANRTKKKFVPSCQRIPTANKSLLRSLKNKRSPPHRLQWQSSWRTSSRIKTSL